MWGHAEIPVGPVGSKFLAEQDPLWQETAWRAAGLVPEVSGRLSTPDAGSVLPTPPASALVTRGRCVYKVAAKPELVRAEPRLLGEIQSEGPGSTR